MHIYIYIYIYFGDIWLTMPDDIMQYHHTATNDEFFLYVVIVQYWLEFQIWIQYITGWNLEWDCAAEYNTFQGTNSLMVRYDENVVATTLINSSIFWKLLVLVSTIIQYVWWYCDAVSDRMILWQQVSLYPSSTSVKIDRRSVGTIWRQNYFVCCHGICDVWVLPYIHCATYILLWVFCWNNNVDDDGGFHCYDNTYCTKFLQQTAEQKYDYTCWNRIDLSICIVVWWCDGSRKYGSK